MLNNTNKSILLLLSKIIGLYILWFVIYDLWLHPMAIIDKWLINNIVFCTSFLLKLFGYLLIPEPPISDVIRTIGIDGTHGLWIGDPCNGLTIMALFVGFIVVMPGKINNKIIYSLLGVFIIHIVNIIRIYLLCIILKYYPSSLAFNHTYSFTFVVYLLVFFMWWIWVKKFALTTK